MRYEIAQGDTVPIDSITDLEELADMLDETHVSIDTTALVIGDPGESAFAIVGRPDQLLSFADAIHNAVAALVDSGRSAANARLAADAVKGEE